MARSVFDKVAKEWVSPEVYARRQAVRSDAGANASDLPSPRLIRDIEPYKSMVTGEVITSRSKHRDHLRRHDLVELGNERPKKHQPVRTAAQKKRSIEQIKQAARDVGMDVL
ncbi:MAG: hypothetical protein KDJ90_00415 [Nitratireductor sp.]|nr:hypothetical protein [Nitratireductor sp.]